MRPVISAFLAAGLAAAATGAMAQSNGGDQVSFAFPNPPAAQGSIFTDPVSPGDNRANLQDSYDHAVMMLKKKMERLTREDGGQLSAAHQASLQNELDNVNRRFHAARFAQR